jgi:hypothetical protein
MDKSLGGRVGELEMMGGGKDAQPFQQHGQQHSDFVTEDSAVGRVGRDWKGMRQEDADTNFEHITLHVASPLLSTVTAPCQE